MPILYISLCHIHKNLTMTVDILLSEMRKRRRKRRRRGGRRNKEVGKKLLKVMNI